MLPRDNRSELVFENKIKAENFYEENLKLMYLIASSYRDGYRKFDCRRKNLRPGFGHHDCSSSFSITQTFPKVRAKLIWNIFDNSTKYFKKINIFDVFLVAHYSSVTSDFIL